MTGSTRGRLLTMAVVALVFVVAGVATVGTVLTNYLYRYSQFDALIAHVDADTYASLTEMYPSERTLFWTGVAAVGVGLALMVLRAVLKRRREIDAYIDATSAPTESR